MWLDRDAKQPALYIKIFLFSLISLPILAYNNIVAEFEFVNFRPLMKVNEKSSQPANSQLGQHKDEFTKIKLLPAAHDIILCLLVLAEPVCNV